MSLKVDIITPKGLYASLDVSSLTLKLITGYRTILEGHAPLIGSLDYASMHILKDGNEQYYTLLGGALNVKKDKVVIITNAIEAKDEIDVKRALSAKKRAEERLTSNDPNLDVKRAELALKKALVRIETANK